MGFDIRMPIGSLFGILGLLLSIYGALTRGSTIYASHSLGLNVNLWWGLVMLFFGLGMLRLSRLHGTRPPDRENLASEEPTERPKNR